MSASAHRIRHQSLIGLAAAAVGGLMAWGAVSIPSAAGYAGVGPNFLPWLVALVLLLCGGLLLREARSGGYRELAVPSGAERGDWPALAWVSAGVLANAALITRVGFIVSCTLCFALAVRGLRHSEGRRAGGPRQTGVDLLTGALIAAPVYWIFTKVLSIGLPSLTGTGWL